MNNKNPPLFFCFGYCANAGRKGARQTGVPRSENVLMSEKQDPENREETPTSNRPASTGRRNAGRKLRFSRCLQWFSRSGSGKPAAFFLQHMFPRAGEPRRHEQAGVSSCLHIREALQEVPHIKLNSEFQEFKFKI